MRLKKASLASTGQAARNSYWAGVLAQARFAVALTIGGGLFGAVVPIARAPAGLRSAALDYVASAGIASIAPFLATASTSRGRAIIVATSPFSPQHAAFDELARAAMMWGALAALLGLLVFFWRRHTWKIAAQAERIDETVRGASVVNARQLRRLLGRPAIPEPIIVGPVPVPQSHECRHTLLAGSTGTGKTTLIFQMLDAIEARGEHALVHDVDSTYISRYYRQERGDLILNPFDERCASWNPLDDIRSFEDASRIANFLVPRPGNGAGTENVWFDHARLAAATIIRRLWESGETEIGALVRAMRDLSAAELRELTAETEAARLFQPGAEKATASVIFCLAECAKIVGLLERSQGGPPIGFDRFYSSLPTHVGAKPWIFIASTERTFEAAKPLLGAWLDCACAAILDRPPNGAPRAWVVLDELPALPKSESLLRVLPLGRKFSASVIIAFQAIGQLRDRFGQHATGTIVGQTSTQVLMRLGDPDSCEWAANLLGKAEVDVVRDSQTLDSLTFKDRSSAASSRETRSVVLDSEIGGLQPLEGYLRIAGYPIAKITVPRTHMDRAPIAIGFAARSAPDRVDSSELAPVPARGDAANPISVEDATSGGAL
jgi:type IV secretory pathway TraG/TraD family ATPase VirD4